MIEKILRKLRLKIDCLFRNADKIYSMLDSGVVSIGRFAAGVVLARLVGAEGFAQYVLLTMVAVFLISLPSTLLINGMINSSVGISNSRQRGMFLWTRRSVFRAQGIGVFCAMLGFPLAMSFSLGSGVYVGFVLATLAGLELLFQRACLLAQFKMKLALKADMVGVGLLAIIVSLVAVLGGNLVFGFWWGSACSSICASVYMGKIRGRCTGNRRTYEIVYPSKKTRRLILSKGRAMLVGSLANSVCSRVQPFVLGSVGGLLAVAGFGAAWTLIGPMRMFASAMSGILRPRLAMHSHANNSSAFRKSLFKGYVFVGFFGGLGVLVSLLVGPELVSVLFGSELRSAGWFLPLAMAYASLDVITSIQMIALQVSRENGAILASKLRIVAAIVSGTLIYPACSLYGAWGAFGALFIAEIVYFVGACKVLHMQKAGWKNRDSGSMREVPSSS